MSQKQQTTPETFHVTGKQLKEKIKEIIKTGNARRIIIRNKEGRKLIEIPVTIGVVGLFLAPIWIAVGGIAAVVAECTITVERRK